MSLPSELCCPACRGPLAVEGVGAACRACDLRYPGDRGYLDFLPDLGAAGEGLGPRLMHSRALARVYERLWRPFFVTVASNGLPDYRAEFEAVLAALASAEGGAVVDLSCGPGFTGRKLAESGRFARVFGVDWSLAMLARAAADNRGLMRPVRGDVGRLPFKTASIAGVHAGAAFHVWPDPPAAVAEVARVVRPGGAFVASTFAHTSGLRRRFETVVSRVGQFHVFEVDQLRGMLSAHGLVDFDCERRGSLILFWARRAGAPAA